MSWYPPNDCSLLPGITPHLEQMVREPATLLKKNAQLLFLLFAWRDAILKHFMHSGVIAQSGQEVKREGTSPLPQPRNGASIPIAKAESLTPAQSHVCLFDRVARVIEEDYTTRVQR